MFAPTHPAFGLGDRGRAGLTTSFGLGAQPIPVEESDREDPGDFVHLLIDLRMKQFCKEPRSSMVTRQSDSLVLLDGVDSGLTKADVCIRSAETDMRHLLIKRRLNP